MCNREKRLIGHLKDEFVSRSIHNVQKKIFLSENPLHQVSQMVLR